MSTIFGSAKEPNSTALIRILNSQMLKQNESLMDAIATDESESKSKLPSREERLKMSLKETKE
jgi:hypothetical protein